jgi:chromosome segregation ATPase
MSHDECEEQLKQCQAKIARLEEENRQLRESAAAFGQLAERLNEELVRERRRRESPRREDIDTPAGHRRHR